MITPADDTVGERLCEGETDRNKVEQRDRKRDRMIEMERRGKKRGTGCGDVTEWTEE